MAGHKGKQGRKKKPDALKIVQGTFRADRENKLQPRPKPGIPSPGRGKLRDDEKKEYHRVCKILDNMNVLAESDVIAAEILAQTLTDYYRDRAEYLNQPRTLVYKDRDGNPHVQRNPTVSIMNEAHKRVMGMLARFGLEPSARASLNILRDDITDEDNPYANLLES